MTIIGKLGKQVIGNEDVFRYLQTGFFENIAVTIEMHIGRRMWFRDRMDREVSLIWKWIVINSEHDWSNYSVRGKPMEIKLLSIRNPNPFDSRCNSTHEHPDMWRLYQWRTDNWFHSYNRESVRDWLENVALSFRDCLLLGITIGSYQTRTYGFLYNFSGLGHAEVCVNFVVQSPSRLEVRPRLRFCSKFEFVRLSESV